ncbi:hypothetical protein E2C01_057397 [Portunus trituberculatus]|uniref:Uncharacterized protein n=1 Tax=Portunus trituberculatus TaxID=210409 RepID=A0A5B7GTD0_PORTR|nr:hypothetical protein [Portunus trituberculatus]
MFRSTILSVTPKYNKKMKQKRKHNTSSNCSSGDATEKNRLSYGDAATRLYGTGWLRVQDSDTSAET